MADPKSGKGGPEQAQKKKRSFIGRLLRVVVLAALLAAAGLVAGFKMNHTFEVNPDKKWPWEAQTEFKDYARSWGYFLGGKGKEYGKRAWEKGKEIDWDQVGKRTQETIDKLKGEIDQLTAREAKPAAPGDQPGAVSEGAPVPDASPEASRAYKDGLVAYKAGLEAFHAANKAEGDAQRAKFKDAKDHLAKAQGLLEEAKEKGYPASHVDDKLSDINQHLQDVSKRMTLGTH